MGAKYTIRENKGDKGMTPKAVTIDGNEGA